MSHSPLYRGTGYLPFCKDCVDEMYEKYLQILGDDREAIRRMCMKLDLYWSDELYEMVANRAASPSTRMRSYIGKTNLVKYIGKTFDDTLDEEAEEARNKAQIAQVMSAQPQMTMDDDTDDMESSVLQKIVIDKEMIDFWGVGYPPDMYLELAKHYEEWTNGQTITDPGERSLYRQLSLLEVTIARDSAQGKPIDKNVNALNSLLGSMNLKPSQKKEDVDSKLSNMPLGVGIQKWEYERPLPPTPPEQKDVLGLVKNITTWFFGHTCKMLGVKNSYCKLYENAMEELRVKRPEYEDEDDDAVLTDIFAHESSVSDTAEPSEAGGSP